MNNSKENLSAILDEAGITYQEFVSAWKKICNQKPLKTKLTAVHFIFYNAIRGRPLERGFMPDSPGYLNAKKTFSQLNQSIYLKKIFLSRFDGFADIEKISKILSHLNL